MHRKVECVSRKDECVSKKEECVSIKSHSILKSFRLCSVIAPAPEWAVFKKLPVFLKLTNTDPFAAWFVVIVDVLV